MQARLGNFEEQRDYTAIEFEIGRLSPSFVEIRLDSSENATICWLPDRGTILNSQMEYDSLP
jgi:hypothetical protein